MAATSKALAEEALTLPATIESLSMLHEALDRFWHTVDEIAVSQPHTTWRLEFTTALVEVAANSIRHAYAPGQQGYVGLRVRLYTNRAVAQISDHGQPYRSSSSLIAVDDDDLLPYQSKAEGFFIAGTMLDWLGYRRTYSGINCWLLLKRLP